MISQISHASSEENFRRTMKIKAGCSCFNTAVSYTRRMIPVVRDFPKGCGPIGRFAAQCSQHLVQSESHNSSSFYDSESKESVVPLHDNKLESVSSAKVQGKDRVPQALDTLGSIDLLETSDHEATELPRKFVSEFMPRGYTARRRASAIRDYPSPPENFRTPFSEDLVQSELPDSRPCYDSEFEDLMVSFPENGLESIQSVEEETPKALDDMKQIDLEEASEYETKALSEEAELEFTSARYDSESEDSIVSMYNISLESLGYSSSEEGIVMPKFITSKGSVDQAETSEHKATDLTEETEEATSFEAKGLNHEHSKEGCNLRESENLSLQCNDQIPEKGSRTGETQVPKQIVIALMAPNCPRCQKKRAATSNTTRDTNKKRKKKH